MVNGVSDRVILAGGRATVSRSLLKSLQLAERFQVAQSDSTTALMERYIPNTFPLVMTAIKYDGATPEGGISTVGGNSPETNIGDVVGQWLADKAKRSRRVQAIFGKRKHTKYHQPEPKPQIPLRYELADINGSEATRDHWGVNRILDYMGFQQNYEKNRFLSGFNGDYYHGVSVIRAAFHVAASFGLTSNGYSTEERKHVFSAIAESVNNRGSKSIDCTIEGFCLNSMPGIRENYQYLGIDGTPALVPKSDAAKIAFEKGILPLASPAGQALMSAMGYAPLNIAGMLPLYYKPNTNRV